MSKAKFKVGDTVRILDGSKVDGYTGGFNEVMKCMCGEIRTIKEVTARGGRDKKPCYYLENTNFLWDERGIERVDEERKIVITTDGKTTCAALYDGHKLIRESKAICGKDDTFDFEAGAKIAFERLTAKPAVKAKSKEELKPLNTKIFVLDGDDKIKSSHIYEIENGKITVGIDSYPCRGTLYTMDDVINYLKPSSLRSGDEKFDSKGVFFSEFNPLKQITVIQVKED